MIDRLREYLDELRENFDDHYWWLRHQMLMASLIALITGAIGLVFAWLETQIRLSATGGTA